MNLHEKKISELVFQKDPNRKEDCLLLQSHLKQWAIAVVKNCKECWVPLNTSKEFIEGDTCPLCRFLINRFELTEEDLE